MSLYFCYYTPGKKERSNYLFLPGQTRKKIQYNEVWQGAVGGGWVRVLGGGGGRFCQREQGGQGDIYFVP